MSSRKDVRAIIAIIVSALVQVAQVLWPSVVTKDTADTLTLLIGTLAGALVLGIAHEDNGLKTGTPPPAAPPVPPAAILLVVLGLGLLAGPAQAIDRVQLDDTVAAATTVTVASRSEAAVPVTATAEPSPLLDFGSLLPAAHGQQLEEGMQGFDVVGVIPLYLLKNRRTGKLGYADPIELSAGRLAVHAYLIAYAALGWPTSRWHAQERAVAIVETKARQALARAGAVAVTQIPQLVGQADTLVAGVLRGLSGR